MLVSKPLAHQGSPGAADKTEGFPGVWQVSPHVQVPTGDPRANDQVGGKEGASVVVVGSLALPTPTPGPMTAAPATASAAAHPPRQTHHPC